MDTKHISYEEYMTNMIRDEENRPAADMVNHPPHYDTHGVECIEAIRAATGNGYEHYLQGNIMKYLWRYKAKDNALQDLQKAQWYLERLVELYDPEEVFWR